MKILKLSGVITLGKDVQKEIIGGNNKSLCIDRDCMSACLQTGQTPYVCYMECMIC